MAFSPNRYVRRTGGTSKGAGSHSNVVQYGTEAQSNDTGALYQPSGNDEGAFRIATPGIYAVSVTAGATPGFTIAIKAGAAVDNTLADATQRAAVSDAEAIAAVVLPVSWVGFLQRGDFVWVHHSGTPSAGVNDNQISISQVA